MRKGNRKGLHNSKKAGLTLFEVIVVIAITGVLIAIIVPDSRTFEKKIVLENLSRDVALTVRTAQSYGINAQRRAGGGFEESFGVHFDRANPDKYFIFRDPDRGVGGYMYAGGGVKLEEFTLSLGYTISDVCLIDNGGADSDCFVAGGAEISTVDIAFDRPKPDAHFTENGGVSTYQSALITLTNPNGATQIIEVLSTGYISLQ